MKEFITKIFNVMIELLKEKAVKLALKKILGNALAGGFKGYVIKWITVDIFEEFALPFALFLKRRGFLVADRATGEIIIKKVDRAKVEKDEAAYLDSISNV